MRVSHFYEYYVVGQGGGGGVLWGSWARQAVDMVIAGLTPGIYKNQGVQTGYIFYIQRATAARKSSVRASSLCWSRQEKVGAPFHYIIQNKLSLLVKLRWVPLHSPRDPQAILGLRGDLLLWHPFPPGDNRHSALLQHQLSVQRGYQVWLLTFKTFLPSLCFSVKQSFHSVPATWSQDID